MTIPEAANILGVQPNRATVHNRIRRELERQGETPGVLFDGQGCLTQQAESVIRATTGTRQEPAPSTTQNSAEAYSKLEAKLEITQRELARVTQYLDDCDRLLGEMCRTINALEERQYRMEAEKRSERRTGALEAIVRAPQVFYSSVLRRSVG